MLIFIYYNITTTICNFTVRHTRILFLNHIFVIFQFIKSYINIKFCMCIERPNSDVKTIDKWSEYAKLTHSGRRSKSCNRWFNKSTRYTKCKVLFCQMMLVLNIKNIRTTKIQFLQTFQQLNYTSVISLP